MKKFLALFLALLMCVGVLASCGGGETDTALDEAKEFLDTMMEDKKGKELANDYKVPGKLVVGDAEFEVTWETDNKDIKIKESSEEGFWTVDLPNVNAKLVEYKLIATIKDADGKTIEATFTLKLPVIDNAGLETEFKADVEYKAYVKQMNLGYDIYVLNTTQDNANKFINTTMDPKEAAVFKFEIVEGGYKIYTDIGGKKNYLHATATPKADKPDSYTKTIGFAESTDCVFTYDSALSLFKIKLNGVEFGVGTYDLYDTVSLSEMKYFKADNINVKEGQFPMGFMTKAHADTLDPSTKPEDNDPKADSTLTIAEAIALGNTKVKNQYTKGKYYIEGTIKEIQNDQNGHLVITDGTNDLLVYYTHSADGKVKFGEFAVKPKVGDKIKVYGVIGKYNDAQMKDGWIVEGLPEGAIPSTPSTPSYKTEVVTTPVAGTAYKFGVVQANKDNKLLFINGEMANTYYFGTTENAADAIDVYLEETTGGYYLYCMKGETKTYINITVSGTHINAVYGTTASTVYTYDETAKTLKTDVTCADDATKTGTYCLGTYSTFTTVSPVLMSKDYFPCQLYTVVEGEGGTETPENPGTNPENPGTEPENPGTTTPEVVYEECTITEALAKDVNATVKTSGIVVEISGAWNSNFNNMSVFIADAEGNKIQAFRLGTQVALGDYITVSGKIGEHSEVKQFAQGATAEIGTADDAHKAVFEASQVTLDPTEYNQATVDVDLPASSNVKYEAALTWTQNGTAATKLTATQTDADQIITLVVTATVGEATATKTIEVKVLAEGTDYTCTIPEALAKEDGEKVIVSGIVTKVDFAWSDSNNNMSVTITDANGDSIYAYKLATKVELGNYITISGEMGTYGGRQIAQGATAEIGTADDAHKAVFALSQVSIETEYNADVNVTLPTTSADATLTWKNGEDTITSLTATQTEEKQTITLTVTATVGEATATKDITVTVNAKPAAGESTVTCDFSTTTDLYAQYADVTHTFGEKISVSTLNGGCHLTTQLRIYASESNDGQAVISSKSGVITNIKMNAGNKNATLDVYGSANGGETWTLITTLNITAAFADHEVSINSDLAYTSIKLDANGGQVRIKTIDVTVVE